MREEAAAERDERDQPDPQDPRDQRDESNTGEDGPRFAAGRLASGAREAEVLAVLQQAGSPLSPGEVRDRVGAPLAYTTVVTILSRLHDKNILERHKSGRAYLYAPVADSPGLAARRMAHVLDGEDDREAVLARFVSALSDRDEELLRRMLADPDLAG